MNYGRCYEYPTQLGVKMTKDALDDFPSKQEILKAISDAVYAQYPKKEWHELSDEDVTDLVNFWNISDILLEPFIVMVANKVKEKNT
jgi:hypothetical protein